jgi:hypothetical protein
MHSLDAHLAELSESSVILILPELSTEFFPMHHCSYAQCPLGRAPQNPHRILSVTVSLIHSLASKVFNNLMGLSPELMISAIVPQHVFV